MKPTVYFSREITPEKVVALYRVVGRELPGKVAVKLHSGEQGNQNFLGPDFWRPMIEAVHGTVVECNTAYEGERNTTEKHRRTMIKHGWSTNFDVDILDAEDPDLELAVPNGRSIQKNFVGKDIANYDSMLVLSHFKGHPMGGFGGAVKNISIGIASSAGKAWIHSAGKTKNAAEMWSALPPQEDFLESMAEAAKAIADHCGERILYINVMNNLSVDCDCDAHPEPPRMGDIGILASLDPVALDKACVDLVYASPDEGKVHLIERMESRHGIHTLEHAETIGLGSQQYELITLQ